MNLYDLIEYAQVKAILNALDPTQESIWRIKCREYSELFSTPLHVVVNDLDPVFVLQQLYEYQFNPSIVDSELPELLEKLNKIKDPNYDPLPKEEMENLVDAVLNKEIERLSKKKTPVQETAKQETKPSKPQMLPKSLDFSDLEKMESKAELNKSGF
jgi:hypothetical protein